MTESQIPVAPFKNFLGLACCIASWACADLSAYSMENAFPAGQSYPDPVGIVYPGFAVAAGVNPAAIRDAGTGTVVQLGYSPSLDLSQDTRFTLSAARSHNNMGFGAGYQGRWTSLGWTHGGFAGVGGTFGKFSLGLSLRDADVAAGINPSADVGMVIGLKAIDVGLVFYGLDSLPRLGIGIGTRMEGSYNVEADILLPPFSNLTASYLFTVSAQIRVKMVLAHFRTSMDTATAFLTHTLGLGIWATKHTCLLIQYSTPQRVVAAITVTL